MKQYDLIVVGGGFAGTSAAISASRNGLTVLLIEQSNALGGAAANALVNPFMPNWTKKNDNGETTNYLLSQGIYLEIINNLRDMDAASSSFAPIFKEEYLKLLLNRMIIEANVDVLFHSYLVDTLVEDAHLKEITISTKSGLMKIASKYFIDATGDADLAYLSGCPYHLGREEDHLCQPMTLCFRVGNVDIDKYKKARPMINQLYKEHQQSGKIKNIREDVLIFDTLIDGILHFNSTRVVKLNPVDPFDLTKAEIDAREQVFELFQFMKDNIDGFEHSELIMTASSIGVRESRMIDGEYLLTGQDLISCYMFEDSIALGNYDIDIHNPEGSGTSHYYFPEGQYYTIPYRCLIPKNIHNLLVAGRCISTTHEAQASIRIMPIVCSLGEAAGAAISIAAKDNIKPVDVNISKLQQLLIAQGAVL